MSLRTFQFSLPAKAQWTQPPRSYSYQLAAVNSDIDSLCDNLEPGEVICLGTSGEDCTTTHVVAADDTCDSITSTYAINSTMLFANNPQIDAACDNIYIGEVRLSSTSVLGVW